MIPRLLIDTADIPGAASEGGGQLKLFQRGAEFSIMLGGNELMNSRLSGSEEALAALAHAKVGDRRQARILIGGLGMGFTLRSALDLFGLDCEIVVAELVPAVVKWARGPMAHIFGNSLTDARVTIVERDVGAIINEADAAFDAILLDVDNGPDGLTRASNDTLYNATGLGRACRALRPGGALLVWSSGPSPAFSRRLSEAGFTVDEHAVRATRSGKGARHVIWVAQRSPS